MDDGFTLFVSILASGVVGLILGLSASNHSWTTDCDLVGKHRSDNKVYFCFPEGGK